MGQNYLISQVLFDGKEDVKSMAITQETDKKSDIDVCENHTKSDDFELKKEQAFFEAYKQNMEEYLDSVCEDKQRKSVVKKEKSKSKKVNRNSFDVNVIKQQFEEQNDCKPESVNLKADIRKLSSSKLTFANKIDESIDQSKKTYVPVIIDREAFDRTVGLFELEKQKEENEKKLAEMKIKKKDFINKVKG